jgi:hypothetical protein
MKLQPLEKPADGVDYGAAFTRRKIAFHTLTHTLEREKGNIFLIFLLVDMISEKRKN